MLQVALCVMATTLFYTTSSIGKKTVNEAQEIVKGGEKANIELQIYVKDVEYYGSAPPPLCSTIVVYATKPFDEHTITWNNRPPFGESLAALKKLNPNSWYNFSSTRLESYVLGLAEEDTIPFGMQILDRHGGVCDIVWNLTTKESPSGVFLAPKLINGSSIYSSIGDAWVTDGSPDGPNSNYGWDPEMLVCSCTLTCQSGVPPDCNGGHYASGTQLSYVEFYIQPTGIEEEKLNKDEGFRLLPSRRSVKILYEIDGQFRLYSIVGQKVSEFSLIGKGEMTIKVPTAGIYFGVLNTGEKRVAKKVVVF
ncbi:MAG: T9SS type A sorting domain-containing protein [Candidatus Stahlbacteria bacterium]|nr:T9SS type A sorting domain-containing protein [Candidatus Stahlbacteria bacterium]